MEDDAILSPIQQFYKDKSIFITGATGFVGKILLEKLLRCCPDVAHVYLMIREKKGKIANERIDMLFNNELFNLVKKKFPHFRKKVSVIYGNLDQKGLGINAHDIEKLRKNVNIVFHTAARVNWTGPLKLHAQSHIIATKALLDIAKTFENIEVIIHVSSIAVYTGKEPTIPECVIKHHVSPEKLINALEWLDDESLKHIQKYLENTYSIMYVFTKALAENVVEECHGDVPTAIVRPSMVTATYKDPLPGWCDVLQSFEGMILAICKGVFRHLYMPSEDIRCVVVPVDVVANTIIATAWYMKRPNMNIKFLVVNNAIESEQLPFMKKDIQKSIEVLTKKYPFVKIFRYPSFTVHSSYFWYRVCAFLDDDIPGALVDCLAYIFTKKTFMLRLNRKIDFMAKVILRIGQQTINCNLDNSRTIQKSMCEKDSDIFVVYVKDFQWREYMEEMWLKGRKILGKEDNQNLEYARKKAKIWLISTSMMKWCVILYFGYLVSNLF